MNKDQLQTYVDARWEQEIIPELVEYIKIPNKSPFFDPEWQAHGYMDQAVNQLADWCRSRPVKGMQLEIIQIENRTPLIFIEIAGQASGSVLLYGHLDKQPEMLGWDADKGPWLPLMQDERLYGRGGADDGYAVFAALTAIEAIQQQNVAHGRCLIVIEACEESGSYDLPYYVESLKERIGQPDLVVCLDSGCGNYQQLWLTTSLRGMVVGELTVEVLEEGVHSGSASGIVPSSFRILRQLLDRIEDSATGQLKVPNMFVDIPGHRVTQAQQAAKVLGDELIDAYPFSDGVCAVQGENYELILNRTWRPTLCYTGAEGLPKPRDAGNVLRPSSKLVLAFRLPPTVDPATVEQSLTKLLTSNPPYNAKVTFELHKGGGGWHAPAVAPWLDQALQQASDDYFGQEAIYMGEGGSIPFMGMLGEKFPKAQFMITGVLGPHSNAHGPNEFLHIPTGKKITCCVAHVLATHAEGI